jgi:hypothetical protein
MKYRVRLNSIIVRWQESPEDARAYAVLLASQAVRHCEQGTDRITAQARTEDLRHGKADDIQISVWRISLEEDLDS